MYRVLDEEDVDTNIVPNKLPVQDTDYEYYFTTDEGEKSPIEGASTIVDNDGDKKIEEEVDIYYYYYTDESEDTAPAGSDSTAIDTAIDNSDAGTDELEEEVDIYYYYTDESEDTAPEGTDNTAIDTNPEGNFNIGDNNRGDGADGEDPIKQVDLTRRCPLEHLTESTSHMSDLSFTFAIDANATMVDEVIAKARLGLLDNVADASLICQMNRNRRLSGRANPAGIYEIRYVDNEAMKKVSECHHNIHGNRCFVYTGILRLVSDQTITLDEHILASTRIHDYVNSVEKGMYNVASSIYLGPEIPHTTPPLKNNAVDHFAVPISISFFISALLFVAYRHNISRSRKRKVTFCRVEYH